MLNRILNSKEISTLKSTIKFLEKKDFNILLFLVFLVMVSGLAEMFGIGIVFYYISILTNIEILNKVKTLLRIDYSSLVFFSAILILGIYILKNSFLLFTNYASSKFVLDKKQEISNKLFSAYMYSPYNQFILRSTSTLQVNVLNESSNSFNNVIIPFVKIFADFISSLFIVIFLFVFKPLVTFSVVTILSMFVFFFYLSFRRKNIEFGRKRQEYARKMVDSVSQSLGGFKNTRILNKETYFIKRFELNQKVASNIELFTLLMEPLPRLFMETLIVLIIVLIILFVHIFEGNIKNVLPVLSLFAVSGLRIMMISNRIINQAQVIQFNGISVDTLLKEFTFLKETEISKPLETKKTKSLSSFSQISLRDLSFRYLKKSEDVIKNINLIIPRNSSVAFVGESGVGKSTLIDLIAGLLEPTSGEILIDQENLQTISQSWKKLLGYIPQSVFLTNGDLASNIAFGVEKEDINEEQIWKSLELAQLAEHVRSLPDTIYSNIGENGVMLSGGQRQRIGIARALYNDPEVIILDEATAALDNKTEKEFVKALESLNGQKTMIYIAHRLSTVKNCDQIYFMKAGKIFASGSFEQLVSSCKEFAQIANI